MGATISIINTRSRGDEMKSEEIAKLANVSRSTVSRVINNYPNVPKETREKIQKIIDEYGYTPNASARTLAGKANNIIGLFIADIDDTNSNQKWIGTNSPYNAELIAQVIASCKRRGYLTLVNTISELKELQDMKQYFENRMIFGGIFIGFPYETSEIRKLMSNEYNIVLIDQLTEEDDVESNMKLLNCNNIVGGYEATKYLLEKGHTKIAHISGDTRLSSIQREAGYRKAMAEHQIAIGDNWVVSGAFREQVAYTSMKTILQNTDITAVFVANDIMALGVTRAIKESGKCIPDDISIIGYDNLAAEEWIHMDLTTMEISLESMAEQSVAILFGKDKCIHEECQAELVERKSVKTLENSSL